MPHLITFKTSKFDVSKETPNPINPVAGEGVLTWIRGELSRSHYDATVPAAEDWGWYIDIRAGGSSYLIGASAEVDGSASEREWTVQLHKTRSLTDKLLGRNKLSADDPLSALVERIVRSDNDIRQVEISRDV